MAHLKESTRIQCSRTSAWSKSNTSRYEQTTPRCQTRHLSPSSFWASSRLKVPSTRVSLKAMSCRQSIQTIKSTSRSTKLRILISISSQLWLWTDSHLMKQRRTTQYLTPTLQIKTSKYRLSRSMARKSNRFSGNANRKIKCRFKSIWTHSRLYLRHLTWPRTV